MRINNRRDKVIWVKIEGAAKRSTRCTYIGFVYIPPECSPYYDADDFNLLQEDVEHYSCTGDVILCGDFNSRTGGEIDHIPIDNMDELSKYACDLVYSVNETCRHNVDVKVNNHGRNLLQLCKATGLQICNGRLEHFTTNKYTYYKQDKRSTIDYLIAPQQMFDKISNFEVGERNMYSDHCTLTFKIPHLTNNKTKLRCNTPKQIYRWNKTAKAAYCRDLNSSTCNEMFGDFLCDIVDSALSNDDIVKRFYDVLHTAFADNFKLQGKQANSTFPCKPWFDNECKTLKSLLHKRIKVARSKSDEEEITKLKRDYKRLIQYKKRAHCQLVAEKIDKLQRKNPNDYWAFWKKYKRTKAQGDYIDVTTFTKFYSENGDQPMGSNFDNELFEKISNYFETHKPESHEPNSGPLSECINAPITTEEVIHALKKLKTDKATGLDGIAAEFYKFSDGILNRPLVALFNYIFDNGEYPSMWCEGMVNPIHKTGMKCDPANYRKITVLSAAGKIFDIIMNTRLSYIKSALNTEDPRQNGFKAQCSAVDNAFTLNGIINKYKLKKRPLYVCFVDLKSAFDNVDRRALLLKMLLQGIDGKYLKILKSMFDKAKSQVRWNNQLGEVFDNVKGVLQGGVTSPTLFKLFLEDLPKYLDISNGVKVGNTRVHYLLQADDLILISETGTGLQKLINGLNVYCKRWHLTVNLKKTKIMIFNKKYETGASHNVFYIDGDKIPETDRYDYLGITFTTSMGKFELNTQKICDKARRAIYAARSNARAAVGNHLGIRIQLKIFDTQIQPIMEYGVPVWFNGKPLEEVERVHTQYIKQALGVKTQTSTLAVYGETGRYPMILRQQYLTIKYWLRLISLKPDNILSQLYTDLRSIDADGSASWVSTIREILNHTRYAGKPIDELENMGKQIKCFAANVHEDLKSKFAGGWKEKINDSAKNPVLRTYRTFKFIHESEPYIHCLNDRYIQTYIAKLRVSSHHLRIEEGRHCKPKILVEKRLCIYCNVTEIDDEQHFITSCRFHDEERKKLYAIINEITPELLEKSTKDVFTGIMSHTNACVLYSLGKYICNSFRKRKHHQLTLL